MIFENGIFKYYIKREILKRLKSGYNLGLSKKYAEDTDRLQSGYIHRVLQGVTETMRSQCS